MLSCWVGNSLQGVPGGINDMVRYLLFHKKNDLYKCKSRLLKIKRNVPEFKKCKSKFLEICHKYIKCLQGKFLEMVVSTGRNVNSVPYRRIQTTNF